MTHPKTLAVDIDGVVLDHPLGMYDWAISKGIEVGCRPEELDSYTMSPMFPGKTQDEIYYMLVQFSLDEKFANLPPIPGFIDALRFFRNEEPDLRVIAITAPGADERTRSSRIKNVECFGFDEVHVLELGASKKQHLMQLPPGTVYVDDLLSHVLAADLIGLQAFLFRQPHNVRDNHHRVLSDWQCAVPIIANCLGLKSRAIATS